MGPARALVNIQNPEDQLAIYEEILKHDHSVRKVEELVRQLNSSDKKMVTSAPAQKHPQEYGELQEHLSRFFKTKVDFSLNNKGKGKIVIPFGSSKDLERIIGILDKLNG
jgi:ParB family chromosome partitioning protein